MSINIHVKAVNEVAATMYEIQSEDRVPEYVVEKLKLLFEDKLQKVILFGSRARGDHNQDSDFDFIIMANFTEPSWVKRAIEIDKYIPYFGHSTDYIPITEWEFENKFFFRKAVKKEGIVLYDRGY